MTTVVGQGDEGANDSNLELYMSDPLWNGNGCSSANGSCGQVGMPCLSPSVSSILQTWILAVSIIAPSRSCHVNFTGVATCFASLPPHWSLIRLWVYSLCSYSYMLTFSWNWLLMSK